MMENNNKDYIEVKNIQSLLKEKPTKENFILCHIKHTFKKNNRLDIAKIHLYSIRKPYGDWVLLSSIDTGELFLLNAYTEDEMYGLLSHADANLFLDGELCLEKVDWVRNNCLVIFYKHYLETNSYQQVIVGYETPNEFFIHEEKTIPFEIFSERLQRQNQFVCEHIYKCFSTGDVISDLDIDVDGWLSKRKVADQQFGLFRLRNDTSENTEDNNDAFLPSLLNLKSISEPHLACVLLIDSSELMKGERKERLEKALTDFKEQICIDELAVRRVDVAIVAFNDDVRVIQDFLPITKMKTVTVSGAGKAAMGNGINIAIDKAKERTRFYHSIGAPSYKPWIFLFSTGVSTDDIEPAKKRISEEESNGENGISKLWAIDISKSKHDILASLTKRYVLVDEIDFTGIFDWIFEDEYGDNPIIEENTELNIRDNHLQLPSYSPLIPEEW